MTMGQLKAILVRQKRMRAMRNRADVLAKKWYDLVPRIHGFRDTFEWRVYEHWCRVGNRTLT